MTADAGRAVAPRWNTPLLLLGAAGFVVIGLLVASLAGAVVSLGPILLWRWFGLTGVPEPSAFGNLMVVAYGFQASLLAAAVWRSRRLGSAAGFGPIRRWRLVLTVSGAMLVWLVCLINLITMFPALRDFARSNTLDVLADFASAGPVALAAAVVLVGVLAPLSEELFFRGWLWEALRLRGHGVVALGLLTTLPWLLLHGIDSPGRVVFLIPAGMALFYTRWRDGSVRASLFVHMVNNAAAVLSELLAWYVHHA